MTLRRDGTAGWWIALQLAPVLVVVSVLFGAALALAVAQSLGYAPWFGVNTFPDGSHFAALWGSRAFWASLGLTLAYATASTAGALVLGTALAVVLTKAFPGKAVFGTLYKLPLMVPYIVGVALAVLMMGQGGVASRVCAALGVIDDPAQFPRVLHTHHGWGIVAVYVWKQTPFVALVIHAVLLGMGRETQEAAAILGARTWTIFRAVTLPQILPGLVSAGLICFAFSLGAFEAPFILGGGYPDTLPVMAWRLFNDSDYALQVRGMAVVVSIALVAALVLLPWLAAYRRWERGMGRR